MGNIPAKITGKYQSYDINTPHIVTPAPTLRRNTNLRSERNEYIDFTEKDHRVDAVQEYIQSTKDLKIYQFGMIDEVSNTEQNDGKASELDRDSNRKWFSMEDDDYDDDLNDDRFNCMNDHANNAVNQLTQAKLDEIVNEYNLKSKLNEIPIDVTNESVKSILIDQPADFIDDHIEKEQTQKCVDMIY